MGDPARPLPRTLEWPRLLVGVGGVLLAVSPFLTWMRVVLRGDLNLFSLSDAAHSARGWAWAPVAIGAIAGLVAVKAPLSALRPVAAVGGLLTGLAAVGLLVDLGRAVDKAAGL